MSDPAVEAAQRASDQYEAMGQISLQAVAAAREALNPIRDLHRRDGDYCWTCEHTSWPCPTARLVYTSEELGEQR